MTKKEFKKKCKQEKTTSYKLMLSGGIIAAIGLIVVAATMFLSETFNSSITGYILGIIIALIGMILDLLGESMLAKDFKKYRQ